MRSRLLLPALVAVLAGPPAAFASVTVTTNAQRLHFGWMLVAMPR